MRSMIVMGLVVTAGCINATQRHDEAAGSPNVPASPAKLIPNENVASPTRGLDDLDAMTFDCPKAGLNAAAREAAKVPSQGTYQFSYFKIINDAHHASYEVHFKSNYVGEPELRYCVSMYCQQGWDPNTTRTDVRLMSDERSRAAAGRQAACGAHADAAKKERRRE
jgi:hypothetical protein